MTDTMESILEKTLGSMNPLFSSNEFCIKAKRYGITKRDISSGQIGFFLHRRCDQSKDSRRMWYKRSVKGSVASEIDEAISLLKRNGYKVMSQVAEWKEL